MIRWLTRLFPLLGLFAALVLVAAPPSQGPPTSPEIYRTTLHAIAWVIGSNKGTGWLADRERRLLVTNLHVVGDREKVEVVFPLLRDGRVVSERAVYQEEWKRLAIAGRVVKRDPDHDLALIQLDSLPDGVFALPLAVQSARPGDRVHSVGNRRDAEALWVHASGVVRSVCRTDEGYFWQGTKLARGATILVTQSPILEGDSGGPLVNDRGELVGVIAAVRWQTPSASVAIDVNAIRNLLAKSEPGQVPQDGSPNTERFPGPDVADKLMHATAWLRTTETNQRGTGWLLDRKARLLLTTAKVVGQGDTLEVVFAMFRQGRAVVEYSHYRDRLMDLRQSGQVVRGTVLVRDPVRNLAVVELASVPDDARELKLATTDPLPGEQVHTMSHPNSIEALWLYATGVVRQVCRARLVAGDGPEAKAVFLQLPGGLGDGGGPVVNDAAEVVAVTSSREGPQQLLAYGTALSEVKAFLTESRPRWAPNDVSSYRQRAALYARTRQYQRAEEDLDQAIKLCPEEVALFPERGRVRRLRGNLAGASADCDKALQSNPKLAAAHLERAAVMLASGKLDQASVDAQEALRIDDRCAGALALLGEIGYLRGESALALNYCDKALDLDPNLSSAYLTRGRIFLKREGWDRAIVDFTRAFEFDPQATEALRWRAEAYRRQGEWKKALADCDQALEMTPNDPRAHFLRAAVLSGQGEDGQAWSHRVRAIWFLLKRCE